ncbi:helix-turn-helix domain-containing protein [Amycolatopsis sp. NPDC006131]|uniref:AraC family transcriptional regulator n=1 Tax=Amycolatopsis sp. NPDC006131 TaxID=3156731 RepID=UPI0033A4AC5D
MDFRAEALSEGSVFWLRPGQVHHVLEASDLHVVLLLFTGAALAPGTPVAPLVAAAPAVPGPASAVFQRFAAAVEADHARRHHVRDYEQAVHASARTIDRAVRRARGMSAKRFLDERIVLEARRRLATTDTPVAALAAQLGFTEATNFVKFHRRLTGTTPRAA